MLVVLVLALGPWPRVSGLAVWVLLGFGCLFAVLAQVSCRFLMVFELNVGNHFGSSTISACID